MVNDNSIDIVGRLMAEHNALIAFLPQQEVSLRISADAAFRKTLLMSAASYFEVRMAAAVIDIFSEATNHSEALLEFVRTRAVDRRYHDWFDWKTINANKFFGAFGVSFKSFMADRVKEDTNLEESIRAFMEIGTIRNRLAHENFALFNLNKTVSEIFEMYQKALNFVDSFPDMLEAYLQS